MKQFLIAAFLLISSLFVYSQDISIDLPEPVKTGGKPLMEALNDRQSNRNYTGKALDNQTLSNLLWAAHGFNRPDRRTSATSQNKQEMSVYVLIKERAYLYDAKENKLKLQVSDNNLVSALGQPNVSEKAAITLVYVADMTTASNREAGFVDTGAITQNVYLYCASEGLGVVTRASFKRPDLHDTMKLKENEEITVVQAVGVIE